MWYVNVVDFLDFKLTPCFESCMYSFGYFPGVRLWFADVSESSISSIQPLKMELIEDSETSANNNRTPGKYPKEYIQYSKHGESLKSRRPRMIKMLQGATHVRQIIDMSVNISFLFLKKIIKHKFGVPWIRQWNICEILHTRRVLESNHKGRYIDYGLPLPPSYSDDSGEILKDARKVCLVQ